MDVDVDGISFNGKNNTSTDMDISQNIIDLDGTPVFDLQSFDFDKYNVIIVKCEILTKHNLDNIINRFAELRGNCFGSNYKNYVCHDFQQYTKYVAMYFETPFKGYFKDTQPYSILRYLNDNMYHIKSMMTLVIGLKGIAEIYDVCTVPESRRLGYSRQLFINVFNFIKKYITRIWLAIDLNQTPQTIDNLFRFYSNLGFKKPTLTKTTGGVFMAIPDPVLGLYWESDSPNTQDQVNHAIITKNIIVGQYTAELQNCKYSVKLPKNVANYIRNNYLNESVEYGGGFDFNEHDNQIILDLNPNNMIRGQSMSTNAPTVPFSFHTHPISCNIKLGCYSTWPSGEDMSHIITLYPITLKHYVFTVEGIYSIQLTSDMQNIIYNMDSIEKYNLINRIRDVFGELLWLRETSRVPNITSQYKTLYDFFSEVGRLTIGHFLPEFINPESNVLIYYINFYKWDEDPNPQNPFYDDVLYLGECEYLQESIDTAIKEEDKTRETAPMMI